MKCNFINIKAKANNKKVLELFKLSLGNKVNSLYHKYYNKINKEYQYQNVEIVYFKKYLKKNNGKMIYKETENNKKTKILNEKFILNNMKRAKIIINNKQYKLKEIIENKNKKIFKIKIKFLDII